MVRSVWKGLVGRSSIGSSVIWKRGDKILSEDVGKFYKIYNGKRFIEVLVEDKMVGRSFGEYAVTRSMGVGIHLKKKKKKSIK